jgi:Protein of unknown function (DUF3305)
MQMASMPIAVIMQRRSVDHPWASEVWEAIAVVADRDGLPPIAILDEALDRQSYLVSGLELQLYPDENEGYFENCVAPEPKVFVKWRMEGGRAMPVQVSVSYADGARMFDSGESADGVAMPAEIVAWLAAYLHEHYEPPQRRGKHYKDSGDDHAN